jgi:hypothetical protein
MKHFQLKDFHPDNYHLYVEKPDPNFSAKKNYAVIQETIKEYDKMYYGIDPKVAAAAADRADILTSYGIYRFGRGTKKIEGYLGKHWMAKIYGEKLMEKIKIMDTIRKLNRAAGNTKFLDYYLN